MVSHKAEPQNDRKSKWSHVFESLSGVLLGRWLHETIIRLTAHRIITPNTRAGEWVRKKDTRRAENTGCVYYTVVLRSADASGGYERAFWSHDKIQSLSERRHRALPFGHCFSFVPFLLPLTASYHLIIRFCRITVVMEMELHVSLSAMSGRLGNCVSLQQPKWAS